VDRLEFNQNFFQFIGDTQKIAYDLTLALKPQGLTNKTFSVMEHLYYHNDQTTRSIAEDFSMSLATVRRLLNQLSALSFVSRQKQGRGYTYRLTKEGRLKLDACFFEVVSSIQDRYKHIDNQTLSHLNECMTYITKKMY